MKLFWVLLILGMTSVPAFAAVVLLDKDSWRVQLGGFVELDTIVESTRSFTELPGNGPVARVGTFAGDNGRTQLSVRGTRANLSVFAPVDNEMRLRGFLEADFLGYDPAPSPTTPSQPENSFFSNPTFRLRHAYLVAEKERWSIYAGQFWTLFGWQSYYAPNSVAQQAVPGATLSRTAQLTFMNRWDHLEAAASVTRPPQRDSAVPGLDFGLRTVIKERSTVMAISLAASPLVHPTSFAITGTVRDFVIPVAGSTRDKLHYLGYGLAVDAFLPIFADTSEHDHGSTLTLIGEGTMGRGYGDFFPGWTGNLRQFFANDPSLTSSSVNLDPGLGGFDANGNFQLVNLSSFSFYLQYQLPAIWRMYFNAGYAQLDSNNVTDLGGGYRRAQIGYFNVVHDITVNFRASLEYAYLQTLYADGASAHNHRIHLAALFRL